MRDLKASLKEASDRLSKYDGQPESEQIRQRMLDLEVSRASRKGGRGGGEQEERKQGHSHEERGGGIDDACSWFSVNTLPSR